MDNYRYKIDYGGMKIVLYRAYILYAIHVEQKLNLHLSLFRELFDFRLRCCCDVTFP